MQKQTREDKKGLKECCFLIRAMQCYDDFPQGEIEKLKQPDFRITQSDGKRIGIELTEYFRGQDNHGGSKLRRDEKIRQKIANSTKRLYELKSDIPLWVTFSPCVKLEIKNKSTEDIAIALVDLIIENINKDVKTICLCESENHLFQNVLSSLTITHLKGSKSSEWGFVESGFIPIYAQEIQAIINGKNDKCNSYLQYCDEVWLLIVSAGNNVSSSIGTDGISRLSGHKYCSGFERILFYDDSKKSVDVL